MTAAGSTFGLITRSTLNLTAGGGTGMGVP